MATTGGSSKLAEGSVSFIGFPLLPCPFRMKLDSLFISPTLHKLSEVASHKPLGPHSPCSLSSPFLDPSFLEHSLPTWSPQLSTFPELCCGNDVVPLSPAWGQGPLLPLHPPSGAVASTWQVLYKHLLIWWTLVFQSYFMHVCDLVVSRFSKPNPGYITHKIFVYWLRWP